MAGKPLHSRRASEKHAHAPGRSSPLPSGSKPAARPNAGRPFPGRAPGRLLGALMVLAVLAPRTLYAHAVGISRGEYELRGATVTAALLFAGPEIVTAVPELDADHDGSLSDRELRAGWPALDEAIAGGVEISASAGRCAGRLIDAAMTEEDGLRIRAEYHCAADPAPLAVTLRFLDLLSHGHRHLATVGAGAG